jgi:hypothetical protein
MGTRSIRLFAVFGVLLLCSNTFAQFGIEHIYLDPLVTELHGDQDLIVSVQTYGAGSEVTMVFADGSIVALTNEHNGRYSILIPHERVVANYEPDRAHRNYVGYFDLGTGSQANLFVDIDDGGVPRVTVEPLDEKSQVSPRLLNLLLPEAVHLVDGGVVEGLARRFYESFGDDYDFLNIINSNTEYKGPFFRHAKNDISGLGLAHFDSTQFFGSSGRLEGVLGFPNASFFDAASPLYLRHLGYRWMNYSHNRKLAGASPHWPISEIAHGIMGYQTPTSIQSRVFPYYFQKEWVGNFFYGYYSGNYFLFPDVDPIPRFRAVELYLMGLIDPEDIRDISYLVPVNQSQDVCAYCLLEKPFELFSVDDLIASEGARLPDCNGSKKDFRAATIVISTGRLLSDLEMSFYDLMAARGEGTGELRYSTGFVEGWARPFQDATYGLGSLSTLLNPDLEHHINHGVSDAWYAPEIPGQGIFVDVFPESRRIFIGWFTHDIWNSATEGRLGDGNHRWLTAEGTFDGPRAELTLFETSGGLFASDTPVTTTAVGSAVFTLRACSHATLEFTIESGTNEGKVDLRRISDENTARCEALQGGDEVEPVADQPGYDDTVFRLDEGVNGAWFNPAWPGQGMTVTVLPESKQLFLAWYTFDLERPDETVRYRLGDPGHRWLTAQGDYEGNRAELKLYLTSGGLFLSPYVTTDTIPYGSLSLRFDDCTHATVYYEIPFLSLSGEFPITRISNENAKYCAYQ